MIDSLNRLIAPLARRVANMVGRAVVTLVDDSTKLQLVQVGVLADETRDGVERMQNYGFTSVPLKGAEALVVFVGGRREHAVAPVVDDRRYRVKGLQPGEVAVYTDQGDRVVFKRGGTIEFTATTKVKIDAPLVELAGNTAPVAKGPDLNTAIATLGTAIGAAVATITTGAPAGGAAAATAITTAVTAFTASATAALSTKVKLS